MKGLLILSLFTYILTKDYWRCGSKGEFNCHETETCCRHRHSPIGWMCFPQINGVCCSDGLTICPENSKCDVANKSCDKSPNSLAFLSYENSNQLLLTPRIPLANFPGEAAHFLKGFVEGTHVFKNVTRCNINDKQAIDDVLEVYADIKQMTSIDKILPLLEDIIPKLTNLHLRINDIVGNCEAFYQEGSEQINSLIHYFKNEDYPVRLLEHLVQNFGPVGERLSDITLNWKNRTSYENGENIGELEKFLFHWNFN